MPKATEKHKEQMLITKARPDSALAQTGHTTRPLISLNTLDRKTVATYLISDLMTPANPNRAEFIEELIALCEKYQQKL